MGASPSGVAKAPSGYNATPSNATKCEGPTSTATSNARVAAALYAYAPTGPENMRPACCATIARTAPPRHSSAGLRYASTSFLGAPAVRGYQVPATALGLVVMLEPVGEPPAHRGFSILGLARSSRKPVVPCLR